MSERACFCQPIKALLSPTVPVIPNSINVLYGGSAREVIVALARPNRNKNIQLSNLSGVPLKAAYHGLAGYAITNTRTSRTTKYSKDRKLQMDVWETVFQFRKETVISLVNSV